jgi:hypothetical protein
MLLRFRVANYRSLRDEHMLSFVATDFNEGSMRSTSVKSEGRELQLVPAVGIFGGNASGKPDPDNVIAGGYIGKC